MKALRLSSGLRVAAEFPLRPVKMRRRHIDSLIVAIVAERSRLIPPALPSPPFDF